MMIAGYDFEGPFSSTDSLHDEAGVYVILDYRPSRNSYIVLDVGESTTVKTRVENHDRTFCWTQNQQGTLYCAALYMPNSTRRQRMAVESAIRDEYNPPCGHQ